MTTVFNRLGHYEIHEQIGSGGMAVVFLATDTRTDARVALKLVSVDAGRDAQEILEAERWGAKLQEEFSRESRYVPAVYEYGTEGRYFFIAMEYLDGRNLSEVIGEGPMPADRAVRVATQLCEFLREADTFERTLDGRTFNLLLHGDLKPRNIRVLGDDEIKVFDFGIAKALSLSRKVTRNDFGSIAYLSPERLESGDIDAQAEFWAVGVLLYEMVSGVQPFRAADTRRLEQRIRARTPPVALNGNCPGPLQAIIAKLLAPNVEDRYRSAGAIHEDLRRFAAGEPVAAQAEGWPARERDEPATRRTRRPVEALVPPDEVTRRTAPEPKDVPAAVAPTPVASVPAPPPAVQAKTRGRLSRLARKALVALAFFIVLNELRVYVVASALAENVPQELGGVKQMWGQYAELNDGSMHIGVGPLERALVRQSASLSERTFERYRAAGVTVFEREWRLTRDVLALAIVAQPSNRSLRASLSYSAGHLRRINGEARQREKQMPAAQQELSAAVSAFREAAEFRSDWPDPFLGLMRAFVAMEEIERAADALAQAERHGYKPVNRDWALLGEGYMTRAAKLAEPDELESLNRAIEAYTHAIENFSKAAGYGNVAQRLREARRRLIEVQERIEQLSAVEEHEVMS